MEKEHDLAKWLAGEMTQDELIAFQQTSEYKSYDAIAKYTANLEAPAFDSESMYATIINQQKKEKKTIQLSYKWAYRIAAVLVLALGLLFVTQNFVTTEQFAEAGKKTAFNLPDHSKVILNSASQLQYRKWNWKNNRILQLDGEAYFRVAKGKTFDVITPLGQVTVVGTQFNVKARGERFEVECFEGKVKVRNNAETIFITKGEIVTFEHGKQIKSRRSDSTNPRWLRNEITFNNENLESIINELQRQYNIQIAISDLQPAGNFTGTLPADNLDVALKIITTNFPIHYTKSKKDKIILTAE